jgi:predicted nucleic acid-binding protein
MSKNMSNKPTDKTQAAAERGPLAPCQEVGVSSLVRAELAKGKLNPEIRARIAAELEKKNG